MNNREKNGKLLVHRSGLLNVYVFCIYYLVNIVHVYVYIIYGQVPIQQ